MSKFFVIGIGYKPFDKKTHEIILRSDVILVSQRLTDVFKRYEEFDAVKGKVSVLNINETIEFIRSNYKTKRVVLIASGDPLFSGIGRRAIDEFGKDAVEIVPELSSIQMAFSRIKEPWDDAFLISLHGGPDPAKRRRLPYEMQDIPFLVERHNKVAILTDRENNPAEIAKAVGMSHVSHGLPPIFYVCERLGYEDEKITIGPPEEIAGLSFSEPNVVIIQRTENKRQNTDKEIKVPHRFGLTEDEIVHSRGLITKDEVRAVAIHKLRLPQRGVFWDIGSGSGSISVEAARMFPDLKVFAVEKNEEQISNIRRNKIRFEVPDIEIIEGVAPDVLEGLPAPDRVFIGGSGGALEEIIRSTGSRMISGASGIIVVNITKIDSLHNAMEALKRAGYKADISQIAVSRMRAIGEGAYLSPLNPVFILRGKQS
ncbi:MAG: precorrin-6y C5,15-methyltransferase (decarboxylating) subunit CbiE [Nitrospirae bacterium]|nr:precorrin-6y C5,15-methyltransferase (decarboxylating) subunit CbiE [Nitrospirota bacterium]